MNIQRMSLLDLLDGQLDEPEESVKVRISVLVGLPAIPAAEKVLRDSLVKCCDENANWETEKNQSRWSASFVFIATASNRQEGCYE